MSREIERQQVFEAEASFGSRGSEWCSMRAMGAEGHARHALLYAVLYGLLYDTLYSRGRGR